MLSPPPSWGFGPIRDLIAHCGVESCRNLTVTERESETSSGESVMALTGLETRL